LAIGDAEQGRLLGQVLDAIRGRSSITDKGDLETILFLEASSTLIESLSGAGWDMDRVTSRVSERLLMPEKEYTFSAPLGLRGKLPVEVMIGGPHRLKITNKRGPTKESEDAGVELSGCVSAVIEYRAVEKVETVVKPVVGLALALGMAEYWPSERHADVLLNGEPTPLHPAFDAVISGMRLKTPEDLNDLEARRAHKEGASAALELRARRLAAVMRSPSARSAELRNAAGLLFDAVGAREGGLGIALAFMSMEAVLLERKAKNDRVALLREAVAYRVGAVAEERTKLRKTVKDLYDLRSDFVHTGVAIPESKRREPLRLALDVLRREVFIPDDIGAL